MLFALTGGLLYWKQDSTETSASLSVEISAYNLLARLSGPRASEELGNANSIVRWLTRQQNYYGGFSSTQVLRNMKFLLCSNYNTWSTIYKCKMK